MHGSRVLARALVALGRHHAAHAKFVAKGIEVLEGFSSQSRGCQEPLWRALGGGAGARSFSSASLFPKVYISADLFFFCSTNFFGAIVKELVSDRARIIAIMPFVVVGMDCTVLLVDVGVYRRWHPSNSCITCNSCSSRKRGIERM